MPFNSAEDYFNFSQIVRHKYRYAMNDEVVAFIANIIDSLSTRVATLLQGEELWRAQLGYDGVDCERYPYREERMTPNVSFSQEGRVNPKGIVCLYLSSTKETALSEVRPWMKEDISCAKFVVTRPLKIIDCSANLNKNLLSLFAISPEEIQEAVWADIDIGFSIPVSKNDTNLDYIPTQILAELFKLHGFDGIGYKSALTEDGYNIALFDTNAAKFTECQLYTANKVAMHFSACSQSFLRKNHD